MRYLSVLVISIALFSSCHPGGQNSSGITLTEANMYSEDTVVLVAKGATSKNKKADKLFLDAIDAYRNKKKPAASVDLFKQSILLQPSAKAYYELGNALGDVDKLQEASYAYRVADALDYKPMDKLLYNEACLYSRMKSIDSAHYFLISAIEFGYVDVKHIMADKDLENLRNDMGQTLQVDIHQTLAGATDPDKMLWTMFSREFKQLSFPISINRDRKLNLEEGNLISYDYERFVPEMRDDRFSRDVGSEYFRVGLVRNSDSCKILLYAAVDVSIAEGDNASLSQLIPIAYYLVSYNKQGKLIDKMLLGGQPMLDKPYKVGNIKENGDIEVNLVQVKYEKDPDSVGYAENKIVSSTPAGKEFYKIAIDGHFIKQDQLLGMN
jgi:hypothetical protein